MNFDCPKSTRMEKADDCKLDVAVGKAGEQRTHFYAERTMITTG
jgi:hypothetical protein